jgi:hypothetical protein
MKLECFSCQNLIEITNDVGRRDECPKCRADVRVCKNCEFYDPKAYNECHETSAEVIREKDRSNFCDFFRSRNGVSKVKEKEDHLSAAEALFKKS